MNKKIITIILGIILLTGIMNASFVSAERIIDNNNPTEIHIDDFCAGSTVTADFSYLYLRDRPENPNNSSLVLNISVKSLNEEFPVWQGDFNIRGYIERKMFFGLITVGEIPFDCSEEVTEIVHPIGIVTIEPQNGTFYCFDAEGKLDFEDFNAWDTVFLNITSDSALWPGAYIINASMHYLTDTYPPFVEILNKDDFEGEHSYYREVSDIEVQAQINDMNLDDSWGTIFTPTQNITVPFSHESSGIYYFTRTLPTIQEGNYNLTIFAEDTGGYLGNDSTILKIDRTGPDIIAIQPTGEIYEEIIPIKLNVTDRKAGVNTDEVYYRIREMNGSNICPYDGFGTWDCYDSGWVKIDLNSGNFISGNYTDTFDTGPLESGEYWFEAKAEDLLENVGVLE